VEGGGRRRRTLRAGAEAAGMGLSAIGLLAGVGDTYGLLPVPAASVSRGEFQGKAAAPRKKKIVRWVSTTYEARSGTEMQPR